MSAADRNTVSGQRHPAGCACGGVRLIAHGTLETVEACHCVTCRRWSGYFWGAVLHARDEIEWHADETLGWWRSSERARRGFCRVCGSSLFFDAADDGRLEIAAGAFDDPLGRTTTTHIFCAEAGDYYRIGPSGRCWPGDEPSTAG